MKLIATRNQTYKTRHLVAGDPFETTDRLGHLLIAIRKAKPAPNVEWKGGGAPPQVVQYSTPVEAAPLPDDDELTRLRKTARRLGIIVDKRWGSQTLRDKIAQVQG